MFFGMFFFFKQKTAYEMRISDWSSDVCSSDLPVLELENPEMTDGAYIGPSRGHLFPRWARRIGMPRAYGYGASMGAWILDYFSGWAGEYGSLIHTNCAYRGPALCGDISIMDATITGKEIDEQGRAIVKAEFKMKNQLDTTMATATAEIERPKH